jgi:class I fructose-bisphosphate aldolase
MSDLGKQIRLRRLFHHPSGRILVVAMDHGIAWGVLPGIRRIRETLAAVVAGGADAITLHKGVAAQAFGPHAGRACLILKCTSYSPYHPTVDAPVASVAEGVALGADAVAVGVSIGGREQPSQLQVLGAIAREAEATGMPLVAHIYPKGELVEKDQRYAVGPVSYAARVAAELGVDIVKTWYTGSPDTFAEVVAACPARVVLSGGPKADDVSEVFRMTRAALDAGAVGVTFGRNVWEHPIPGAMLAALRCLIHDGGSIEDADRTLTTGGLTG